MEPPRNGTLNEAHSPELPPPHLLLDLSSGANQQSSDSHGQNGTEVSLKTDRDVRSSVFDKPDATCDDVSDISSAPSAATPRSREAAKPAPSKTPDDDDGEVVERRRRRAPSTPRPTSGIPRLSAGEPIRRSTRTASESRQRPKSEITRNSSESVSRSSNFGWNRRPNSVLHQRSHTDPSNDSYGASRSRNSSTSSYQSSGGGRRMEIRSKIGSLDNAKHKPGGGNVKIFNEKKDHSKVSSKCGSLDYAGHKPGGGNVQITDEKVQFRQTAASKVGSMDNTKHKAGGGDVKIETVKVDFRDRATSKVGSLDNSKHIPGGGDKKIYDEKVTWEVAPKVGSLKNSKHRPGGGDIQIFSEVLPWTEPSKPSQQILSQPLNFKQSAQPKVGSFDNVNHNPSGGEIED